MKSASLYVCAALLLSGICFCAGEHDWLERAWQTCDADAGCRYSMYIDVNGHNLPAFQHQLRHHHKMSEGILQSVFGNETQTDAAAVLLWLEVVTENPMCRGANEYFSDVAGCVCRQDKICTESADACEQGADGRDAIFVVTLIASAFSMGYVLYHVPRIKKILG